MRQLLADDSYSPGNPTCIQQNALSSARAAASQPHAESKGSSRLIAQEVRSAAGIAHLPASDRSEQTSNVYPMWANLRRWKDDPTF